MGPAAPAAAALLALMTPGKPEGQQSPEGNLGCQELTPTCPLNSMRAFHPMHPSKKCFQNEGSYFPTSG